MSGHNPDWHWKPDAKVRKQIHTGYLKAMRFRFPKTFAQSKLGKKLKPRETK